MRCVSRPSEDGFSTSMSERSAVCTRGLIDANHYLYSRWAPGTLLFFGAIQCGCELLWGPNTSTDLSGEFRTELFRYLCGERCDTGDFRTLCQGRSVKCIELSHTTGRAARPELCCDCGAARRGLRRIFRDLHVGDITAPAGMSGDGTGGPTIEGPIDEATTGDGPEGSTTGGRYRGVDGGRRHRSVDHRRRNGWVR